MDGLGVVGRGRRSLLRQAGDPGRRPGADQGPFDGGHDPAVRGGHGGGATRLDLRRDLGKRFAQLLPAARARQACCRRTRYRRRSQEQRQLLLGVVGVDHLEAVVHVAVRRERVPVARTGCGPSRPTHRDHPYVLEVEGITATIDYEPAESTTDMFGGNSNWRGPLWFPLNYLVVDALDRYYRFFGDDFTIEYPTGSGVELTLDKIGEDLRRRLISLFLVGPDGRRPCFGVRGAAAGRTRRGRTTSSSTSTSTATTGPGSARRTRRAGPGLVADLIRGRPGDGVYTVGDAARPSSSAPPTGSRHDGVATLRVTGKPASRSAPHRSTAGPTSPSHRPSPRPWTLCIFDTTGGGDPGRAHRLRRRCVARLRERRRIRNGLRLSGRRAVPAVPRPTGATPPSSCSIRTPRRRPARCGSGRRSSATT